MRNALSLEMVARVATFERNARPMCMCALELCPENSTQATAIAKDEVRAKERALISIPLNTAEGAYSRGKNRQARFQSAAASARETLACLETAEAMGFIGPLDPELGALFDRVIGTLVRLIEPRC